MRVVLPRCFLLSALVAALPIASTSLRLNGWYPCKGSVDMMSIDTPFECAEVMVPLCHEGICESDKEIGVFIKRIAASETSADAKRKALWFLQGGPGMSSVVMEPSMKSAYEAMGNMVDVYTMDHRGTGRSFFLQCDAAQAFTSGSPGGVEMDPRELPNCVRDILFQIDNHTEAFSVTSAAKDMEMVVTELNADADVYVYGASYGTLFTERIMHLAPANVKGYILDGVIAENASPFTHRNADRVQPTKYLASFCEERENCASMFTDLIPENGGVYEAWQTILANADAAAEGDNACVDYFRTKEASVSELIKALVQSFTDDPSNRAMLPGLLKLINRCEEADLAVIKQQIPIPASVAQDELVNGGDATSSSTSGSGAPVEETPAPTAAMPGLQAIDVIQAPSSFLMYVIKVSEMTDSPFPTWDEEQQVYKESVFPQMMAADYFHTCTFSGDASHPACSIFNDPSAQRIYKMTEPEPVAFKYEHDQYYGKFATIPDHASVMVINGKLDFMTVIAHGHNQFENMHGGHGKIMVDMDFGPHCTAISATTPDDKTDCGIQIIASYVNVDGNVLEVDTSCMDQLPDVSFLSADELVAASTTT